MEEGRLKEMTRGFEFRFERVRVVRLTNLLNSDPARLNELKLIEDVRQFLIARNGNAEQNFVEIKFAGKAAVRDDL